MEQQTPRPVLLIPKTNFASYDSLSDVEDKIILSSKYTLCNIIGFGKQGLIYETEDKSIVVKKVKGYVDYKIHVLASSLEISPVLYEIIYHEDYTYFIYERMKSHINFRCIPKMDEVVNLFSKMLTNGIFHNDLKDLNIMYDMNDNPKIIDFDSAVYYDNLSLNQFDYYSRINNYFYINKVSFEILFTYKQKLSHYNFRTFYLQSIQNYF